MPSTLLHYSENNKPFLGSAFCPACGLHYSNRDFKTTLYPEGTQYLEYAQSWKVECPVGHITCAGEKEEYRSQEYSQTKEMLVRLNPWWADKLQEKQNGDR